MAGKLVLCRHGQSDWNLKNLFTGWTDVDLTEQGTTEAIAAGRLLHELGYRFDVAYTSVLKRAIRTLWLMLDEMDLMWIPVERSWRLNERHYGALQGLNKAETAAQHGADQVKIWRRSYDIPPPALEESDPRHPSHDPRYAGIAQLPMQIQPFAHPAMRKKVGFAPAPLLIAGGIGPLFGEGLPQIQVRQKVRTRIDERRLLLVSSLSLGRRHIDLACRYIALVKPQGDSDLMT